MVIQEALSVSYSNDVPSWPTMTDHLCDLRSHIYTQAVPTQDVMFLVMMLNALEKKANHIRSQMTSYFLSNPTATSDVLANHISQEAIYKTKNDSSPEVALLAQLKCTKSNKICSNCRCSEHMTDTCFQPGGAMEDKKDEVLAAKAKARADRSKEKGSSDNRNGGVK
jgi:hypothetical protein